MPAGRSISPRLTAGRLRHDDARPLGRSAPGEPRKPGRRPRRLGPRTIAWTKATAWSSTTSRRCRSARPVPPRRPVAGFHPCPEGLHDGPRDDVAAGPGGQFRLRGAEHFGHSAPRGLAACRISIIATRWRASIRSAIPCSRPPGSTSPPSWTARPKCSPATPASGSGFWAYHGIDEYLDSMQRHVALRGRRDRRGGGGGICSASRPCLSAETILLARMFSHVRHRHLPASQGADHATSPEQSRPGLVGLHDARPGDPRRCRPALAEDLEKLSRPGFRVVIYDTLEEFLSGRGPRIYHRLAAIDRRQSGGHLRPDRPHRAVAAGGAAGERPGPRRAARAFLGHGRMGRTRRACPCRSTHPLSFARADTRAVLPSHPPRAAHAGRRTCIFPPGDLTRLLGELRRRFAAW